MAWGPSLPTVPGLYWAQTNSGYIVIIKIQDKSVQKLALTQMAPDYFKAFGDPVSIPEFSTPSTPHEEGWFAAICKDNTKKIVCVSMGDRIHCYDFDHAAEIDISDVASWCPLSAPQPPKN